MQIKVSKSDVLWNYAGTIVSMTSNFVLLPFLMAFLSDEMLGLWYVFVAVGNLVMLFEFGFNPTFSRNFAFCWAGARRLAREGRDSEVGDEADPALLSCLIAACKMVYGRVTLVALAVLAIPGTAYVLHVSAGLDVAEVLASWTVYAAAVLLNLYFLYYAAMLRGIGSIAADNKIKIASKASQLAVTALLLFMGLGLFGAAVGFMVNSVLYRVLGSRAFWGDRRVAAMGVRDTLVDRAEVREVYRTISYNAYKDGAVQVANYAATQASTLICSAMLGLAESGAFSIALQFANAIGNLGLALANSYRPMIQSAYQRGDNGLIRRAAGKGAVVYLAIYVAGYLGVLVVVYPLLAVFKPGSSFSPLVYSGVSLYLLLYNWHSLFASMLCNMNKIPYTGAYIVTSACGLVLSVALIEMGGLGVWGLVLGLALPQLAYNNWKWPQAAAREMDTTVPALLRLGTESFLCRKGK